MRWILLVAAVALFAVAAFAIWSALHDPAFWIKAVALGAAAIAGALAPAIERDFSPEHAAKVRDAVRRGEEVKSKIGPRHPGER